MEEIYHDSFFAMNTRFDAVWWGVNRTRSQILFNEIKNLLSQLELKLSCHDSRSELFEINQKAILSDVKVSDYLYGVLKKVEEYHTKTNGYFDPDYLNIYKGKENLFIFDQSDKSLRFASENTKVDLGAVGKGLALEEIDKKILQGNVENVFLSFGESSILAKGRHPNGDYWPFGLCDMFDKEKVLYSSQLTDHAVSISSNRERREDKNKLSYHIHNPHNNTILNQDKIFFVKSDSPVESEILSTALLISNKNGQEDFLNNFKAEEVIKIDYKYGSESPIINKLL